MSRSRSLFGAFLAFGLMGCGGGGGGSNRPETITISAPSDQVLPGGTLALRAVLGGGKGKVTWSATGGAVSESGLYTAPQTQGTYLVTATVGEVSARKSITVTNGVGIAFTANATPPLVIPRSKLTFAAAASGTADKSVTWTTSGGTIDADGVFTAPDANGTYTITATSRADTSKTATALVQVVANLNVRLRWTDYNGNAKGEVVLSLRPDKAPNTVANYVTLVNRGFYNGVRVHRYVEDFVVQWGSPTSKTATLATLQDNNSLIGTSSEGPLIPFEATGLPFENHVLGMASTAAKGPTQSQMFVTLGAQRFLDPNYVAFGSVASGGSVIDALRGGDTIASCTTEPIL